MRIDARDVVRELEHRRDREAVTRVAQHDGPRPAALVAGGPAVGQAAAVLDGEAQRVERDAPRVELHVLPVDGGGGPLLEQLLGVDAAEGGEGARDEGEDQPVHRRVPERVRRRRDLRGRRAARQRDQREVLCAAQVPAEEDAEEQPGEDRLHLGEQLERRRVDRLRRARRRPG